MLNERMPIVFTGHGSPMNAIEDNQYSRVWIGLGESLPKPKAILAVSAHWFGRGIKINDSANPAMIYDMYGFPEELYQLKYPAPGSPALARRVKELLGNTVETDNSWGIDHGSWSVLRHVFPKAEVPVIQLGVNALLSPAEHFTIGQKLKPLRDEGVLIFGSGNIVHNLARIDWRMNDGQLWAQEFDQYIKHAVMDRRFEDVVAYQHAGESAELAVPSLDHYAPLLYVLGASDESDLISVFNADCAYGSLSMTSYLLGSMKL